MPAVFRVDALRLRGARNWPGRAWLVHRAGLVALALAVAFALESITSYPLGYDLAAYLSAARRLLAGEALYPVPSRGAAELGPFGQFFYPPLVAAAFVPLALLPNEVSFVGWTVFLIAVAAAVCVALVRPLRPELRPWAAAAFAFFFPLGWELRLGNLTLLTLAFCLLAWRWRARAKLAGAAFAVALMLKLLPLVLVAFLIAAGRVRLVVWSGVFLACAVGASWPWLGPAWLDYLELLQTLARSAPGKGSNIVPLAFVDSPARYALPALALATAIAGGRFARARQELETYALYVALAVAPLLSSTVFYTYLTFSLPLLVGAGVAAAAAWPPLRALETIARPSAWVLMQAQLLRQPGRDFTLPLLGLLLLLLVGLAPLLRDRVSSRPRAKP